jgi:hypothetical protein
VGGGFRETAARGGILWHDGCVDVDVDEARDVDDLCGRDVLWWISAVECDLSSEERIRSACAC